MHGALQRRADLAQGDLTIHAQLEGDDRATACGYTAVSGSPIIALARALVEAGAFPHSPLIAFRGDTPCLFVRSIGAVARLRVNPKGTGFVRADAVPIAPPVRAIGFDGHNRPNALSTQR